MATSQLQVLFGSMESILRDPVIAFQRGRSKRMVGMGVRGVMVVMAVVRAMVVVRAMAVVRPIAVI